MAMTEDFCFVACDAL